MTQLNSINEKFLAAAEIEARTPITAGLSRQIPELRRRGPVVTEAYALAKLVELRRRQRCLSIEDLAGRASVASNEVISIERAEVMLREPETLRRIAEVLELPATALLQLAGLAATKEARVHEATQRFAARSQPVVQLRSEETAALEEFVSALTGND
jgi:transcriptional regulator with XRE-family HTH domain